MASYPAYEMAIGGDLRDCAFFSECVEGEGECGSEELGEVEAASEVLPREQVVDLGRESDTRSLSTP